MLVVKINTMKFSWDVGVMKKTFSLLFFATVVLLSSCTTSKTSSPTLPIIPADDKTSHSESGISYVQPTSASPAAPTITGVFWDNENHTINVNLQLSQENWPAIMMLDGMEISQEETPGSVTYRPNAPLDQSPNGIVIGSLPWVNGLDHIDFPCCGSLQFSFPGVGLTNSYAYNLHDFGCVTASTKQCPSEWSIHEGDWIIDGAKSEILEDAKMLQRGNIYLRDSATLTIKNSEVRMERGNTPTIHVYIFVDPHATLIIDHSKIYPGNNNGGLTCVINRGKTSMIDSPASIHYFDMSDGASLTMQNSQMVCEIGGLLQVTGGNTEVVNSTIGALGVNVPAGAHLNVSGLQSGMHFDHWKVQDLIPDADYDLVFDNVSMLKDDLEHGPYERGWIFFLDQDSHVNLSDSDLRKVFMDIQNDTAAFDNLKIGKPSSLTYRDIHLKNVTVEGEWPFTISNSNVTITNSNYLFLQPSGQSTIKLVNSHIVEFIPRDFSGTMIFENGEWTNAGEIFGGVDYHSNSNHFTIKGSLKLADNLRENLQWKNAQVTREFEVILHDLQENPISNAMVKLGGNEYITDENGTTLIALVFDESNYNQSNLLEVWRSGILVQQKSIDFFTESPIRLNQE
jgi:hypothetical protein